MSLRHALASTLHLFVLFAFVGAGLFCLSLPYLPVLRVQMIALLVGRFEVCTAVGLSLLTMALLLFFAFYSLHRGQFIRIAMGCHFMQIDAKVLRDTIEACLKRQFSHQISFQELEIAWGRKIEITISLTAEKNGEELLARAEKELTLLLQQRFGYKKSFTVILKKS